MSRANQYGYLRRVTVIPSRTIDSRTVLTGVADLNGCTNCEFEMICGDVFVGASAALSFTLEHGELANYSDMTPVPDTHLVGLESALDISSSNLVRRIGYRASSGKRFVRVTCTPGSYLSSRLLPVPQREIDPVIWTMASPILGNIIDTNGYAFAYVQRQFGTNSWSGKIVGTAAIEHGNVADGSDMAEVTSGQGVLSGNFELDYNSSFRLFSNGDGNTIKGIGYLASSVNAKRYIRVNVSQFGGSGSIPISACVDLINLPTATTFGVIALLRDTRVHGVMEQ